jgi:hypothetical protein
MAANLRKDETMSLRLLALRFAVTGTLLVASAVGAGWKWG